MTSADTNLEPFPDIEPIQVHVSGSGQAPYAETSTSPEPNSPNRRAASSSISNRVRGVSGSFVRSELPAGLFAATGGFDSSALSGNRVSIGSAPATPTRGRTPIVPTIAKFQPLNTSLREDGFLNPDPASITLPQAGAREETGEPLAAAPFPNGYHFPPSHTFAQSSRLAGIAFGSYVRTPLGFAVTIYGLNVVAWGGMLFLLLCNAGKTLTPSCHHSPTTS